MTTLTTISSADEISRPLPISSRFRKLPPPILIVGMHRSGTSMVAGMLSLLGVYLDPDFSAATREGGIVPTFQSRSDGYAEATAFRLLNERIMARTGAAWNDVEPFLQRRDKPLFARTSLALMQLATFGSLTRDYLLLRPQPAEGPWGWKDPRTSLTLPYWLRLFPQARILHVRRQPEAIAASLMRRAAASTARMVAPPTLAARLKRLALHPALAARALGRRVGWSAAPEVTSRSLLDRDFCLKLIDRYVQECLCCRNHGSRYLEVWFEDTLQHPEDVLKSLTRFAQIEPSAADRQRAIDFVQQGSQREPISGPCR